MSARIVLTGGGTAGHVTPNLALLSGLKERGMEILYIGSLSGIEKDLITAAGINYVGIHTGKFRRNLDVKNVADVHHVAEGLREARKILKDFQPDIVFSKGGYVAVPVVRAAKALHIPAIIHESDLTPGLANRLCFTSAEKICCNFPETLSHLPKKKGVLTGSPIRKELLSGNKEAGYQFTGLSSKKPILLMIGGSLGARALNKVLRNSLDLLLKEFQVIHLTGKGNLDKGLTDKPGYVQYEYVSEELPNIFAISDVVFSRAGANAIFELAALRKPSLLTPLPKGASRGDQILNAESFRKQGFSEVIQQENLTTDNFVKTISELYKNRETYIRKMEESPIQNGVDSILGLIDEVLLRHHNAKNDSRPYR